MESDDEDDLWLIQALGMLLGTVQAGPVPRLLYGTDARFFEAIYNSDNIYLFRDHFRMDKAVYDLLYDVCRPFISMKIQHRREVLAVTLDWLGSGDSCRAQEVKFNLGFATVFRYRRAGLHAILHALADIIKMPTSVPTHFAQKFPYFDQAVGVIDGVHIPVVVASAQSERFRNRKGWTSTNVLIASDWDLNVGFIYPGGEGAAHDSMVLAHSDFLGQVPDNFFVLADAGYALHPKVLTPFRSVRYHLKEWGEESGRPTTKKELYNLRHAKARNVVERLNGCLKRRFKILRVSIECEFVVAKAIIFACACVHNFIRREAASDLAKDICEEPDDDVEPGNDDDASAGRQAFPFDFKSARNWRDWMATAMWEEYVADNR